MPSPVPNGIGLTLDPPTLILTIIAANVLMGVGLLAVSRGYLADVPGASRWSWATLMRALGWLISAVLRGKMPEIITVVAGQVLIQLSFTMYLGVLHEFNDDRAAPRWPYGLLVVDAVLLAFFTVIRPDVQARQALISVCVSLVAFRSAYALWSGPGRRVASHVFMTMVYAVCGAILATRGLMAVSGIVITDDLYNGVWFLSFFVIGTMLTFGFVLMCSERYIKRRQHAQDALKRAALIDDLTQLPNRAMVAETLRQLEADSKQRPGAAFAVLFVDLDHFKYVNDSLGHDAGDQLLIETADRLTGVVRQNDFVFREHEVMAGRFGGDEFVLVLNQISKPEHAVRVAERVLDAMAKPFDLNGQSISVQCSIGISTSLGRHSAVEDLLRDADTAMYRAKAAGRANYVIFDDSMHVSAQKRLRIENELRTAIERGEIAALYQPIVALATGRVVGFEALARWVHPERGVIAPDEFIPIAEETGLILQIGHIVLEQAAAVMERLSRMPGGDAICMNVNVSRRQLVDDRFRTDIRQLVGRLTVPPERLHLELTETAVSGTSPVITDVLHELKALGVTIQLDDFGAGLSSLSLLRTLPLDGLKIDRSFIDVTNNDVQAIAILNGIISLGHSLGKIITVEGISEPGQLATVMALDCDLAQGYLFGRPMMPDDATAMLNTDFSSYCAAA